MSISPYLYSDTEIAALIATTGSLRTPLPTAHGLTADGSADGNQADEVETVATSSHRSHAPPHVYELSAHSF